MANNVAEGVTPEVSWLCKATCKGWVLKLFLPISTRGGPNEDNDVLTGDENTSDM